MHSSEKRKTYFCTSCNQAVRTQIELDAHTRRHANQEAVFTCSLCLENKAENRRFRGSRLDLRKHLEKQHKSIIPNCNICKKRFKTLVRYLDDQFRHVGVSPYVRSMK
ncbi:hypothetical protein CRENBAI_024992 [Crenichthys baileyi]|uniref:C2H2-type domain-containing protein n=1 Tax=Crenichthys baileyi TaxID=28760 RepID=A0AAV9RPC3_9TELE